MDRLIIFGGTFDPIHNGHIRIANYASQKYHAKVMFVPAKNPRWKNPHASIKQRVDMLKITLKEENNPNLFMSTYEVNRKDKINYTIDTLKYFKRKYKNTKLYLLIGMDQVEAFNKWKEANEISKISQILFVSRPKVKIKSNNINKYHMKSIVFSKSGTISSHSIRHLKELDAPKKVLDYIVKNNLYYIKELKRLYKPGRFLHALSVADLAYQISKKNKLNNEYKCYIAGLLHDIAKKVPLAKQYKLMNKYYKNYLKDLDKNIYHQFISEYLAKKIFAISDKEILEAIKRHTTGNKNMSSVAKIIYCADKIEPLRGFDSKELINKCYRNFDVGFKLVLKANKEYLIKTNKNINNKLTNDCFRMYLK